MSNIQKQHKISPAIAWLTIQKFIIFYCPLDREHTRYWQRVIHLIYFEANLWILLIQLLPAANASSAAASLQRMRLASTKNFITAALPHIFVLTAVANILIFPSHFFKRKLKNLRRWDARCFFEPPGQVRWLSICP